jgi:hypothetical protein
MRSRDEGRDFAFARGAHALACLEEFTRSEKRSLRMLECAAGAPRASAESRDPSSYGKEGLDPAGTGGGVNPFVYLTNVAFKLPAVRPL